MLSPIASTIMPGRMTRNGKSILGTAAISGVGARPERFVHGLPTPRALPTAAWINPPKPRPSADVAQ